MKQHAASICLAVPLLCGCGRQSAPPVASTHDDFLRVEVFMMGTNVTHSINAKTISTRQLSQACQHISAISSQTQVDVFLHPRVPLGQAVTTRNLIAEAGLPNTRLFMRRAPSETLLELKITEAQGVTQVIEDFRDLKEEGAQHGKGSTPPAN